MLSPINLICMAYHPYYHDYRNLCYIGCGSMDDMPCIFIYCVTGIVERFLTDMVLKHVDYDNSNITRTTDNHLTAWCLSVYKHYHS